MTLGEAAWTAFVLAQGALDLALWAGVFANGVGCPVGPRREFGAGLARRPGVPPPPPNPSLNTWQPWFRLWGPAWVNLKFAAILPGRFWTAHAHERAAYVFYLRDDLPRAVRAATSALDCGTRPGQWAAQLHYLASAELAVRQRATRARHGRFTFEAPVGGPEPGGLCPLIETTAEITQRATGFEPTRLTVMLLDDEHLPHQVGSRYAYAARKLTGDQICVLPDPASRPEAAAEGLVCEYTRLALLDRSGGHAPAWLEEGLARWVAQQVGVTGPLPEPVTDAQCSPTVGEQALERALARSPIDGAVRRGLGAEVVVQRLLGRFGPPRVRQFAIALASRSEEAAFRAAFGTSQSAFLEA